MSCESVQMHSTLLPTNCDIKLMMSGRLSKNRSTLDATLRPVAARHSSFRTASAHRLRSPIARRSYDSLGSSWRRSSQRLGHVDARTTPDIVVHGKMPRELRPSAVLQCFCDMLLTSTRLRSTDTLLRVKKQTRVRRGYQHAP